VDAYHYVAQQLDGEVKAEQPKKVEEIKQEESKAA
jgi:hypothetical protein